MDTKFLVFFNGEASEWLANIEAVQIFAGKLAAAGVEAIRVAKFEFTTPNAGRQTRAFDYQFNGVTWERN